MPLARFWISAFIPRTVPGYTKTVAAGSYAGSTAVPLPWQARPVNWRSWNAGYLTDQRDFSDLFTASVRMKTWVAVDVTPSGLNYLGGDTVTSGTVEVDIVTGKVSGRGSANLKKCKLEVQGPSTGAKVVVKITSAGSDPLVHMAADIDYTGEATFTISGQTVAVAFDGKVDAFPAFEAYASYQGKTKCLFTLPPPTGHTVINLLGGANTPQKGAVTF